MLANNKGYDKICFLPMFILHRIRLMVMILIKKNLSGNFSETDSFELISSTFIESETLKADKSL